MGELLFLAQCKRTCSIGKEGEDRVMSAKSIGKISGRFCFFYGEGKGKSVIY